MNSRNKEIEIAKQYPYLVFTFTPSEKKQVGTENLINKARKIWFSIQKMLHKSKEKTIDVYLKLIESLVKPIILCACESWGDSLKKECFTNKNEKFYVSIYKQLLGVKKNFSSMKILAELARTPLEINIEIQMFKYLQRFAFIEKGRYVFKAFREENHAIDGQNI